jgi:two-component system NtrC family sensor kinase
VKPAVLVVDDSLTVRMDLDEAFRNGGFATTLCATVAAARDALERSPFTLVVLDVLLPDSDGVEFLKELKATPGTAKVPVMLLSTEAEVRDRVRGLKTGAEEYIGKPYDSTHVVSRARELVRKYQPESLGTETLKILVVDDSATFRNELKAALESEGYEVVTAQNGEEGLRIAAGLRPRAMIVDGVLPGIDGASVIRRLRQDAVLRRTPTLLLTASEDPSGELSALDAGADAYVRKEEDLQVILARLAAILRSSDASRSVEAPASLLGPKKVLAVDDSLTYLQEVGAQLRSDGYEPILAHSGEEALELLAVQPVDCILLDVLMPGMSGHETCRRIKGSPGWRDIPTLMLTAREERADMIEGINAGADDYIPKSSDFEVLKARLRAQLRRKQFEDENRHIREQLLLKEFESAQARASGELAETRARLLTELELKNNELETFSYSVSHDLRTPLRAIDGYSCMLLDGYAQKLDGEGKRLLDVVIKNTRRMGQLIDDLLRFSRLGRTALQKTTVDMAELARNVGSELMSTCPERKIELSVGVLNPAYGDLSLLRQVFQNLIGNAIKYTRPRELSRIAVEFRSAGNETTYSVVDNGVGFEMGYAHKVFGVFQRLHSSEEFEGTGVGLALVKRIIERHGGKVWAEGKVNEGAKIHFTLPNQEDGKDRPQ